MLRRRDFLQALPAAAIATAYAAEVEDGFVSLFDGATFKGWAVREGPVSAFFVDGGSIVVHPGSNFPTWLASERSYENFDFRGEFFLKGWMDSGIYLHAPEEGGRNTWSGIEVKLFHQADDKPNEYSNGAIFPLIAPKLVNTKTKGEWNSFRVVMDWPSLKVWMNGELVQDVDLARHADLRYRLRKGPIGFESLSYPIRFRNLRIKELAAKEQWETLYASEGDLAANWEVSEGKPKFEALGGVLRGDGVGHVRTKKQYRDFELMAYIRTCRAQNGGVLFRTSGEGLKSARHYEIQLHNVEGAHYPTGSLYHFKRASYPRIRDEEWYLFQLFVKDKSVVCRINGENVMEYNQMENLEAGHVELQAHAMGTWAEYKHVRIRST